MKSNAIYSSNLDFLYGNWFWWSEGEITLPRSLRVYFDSPSHEFHTVDIHTKLLELGWCLWNGYDLHAEIKRSIDDHKHIGGYEDTIIRNIVSCIEQLRSGGTGQPPYSKILIGRKFRNRLTLKRIVSLFSDELLLRYRPHYIVECHWDYAKVMAECKSDEERANRIYSPTPATEIPVSEEEIRNINPWIVNKYNYVDDGICYNNGKFDPQARFLLKSDAGYINKFNEKYKGTGYEFILNVHPYTINGNPLKAKVVTLTLNPGYIYEKNYLFAERLHPSNWEVYNTHRVEDLELRSESFMCDGNTEITDRDFWKDKDDIVFKSHRDIQNMLEDWYWYDVLERFRKEAGLPEERSHSDVIYDNFALIQYIGYSSKSYKALPAGVTLPSQRFTKLLIHHLAMNKKDVVFVVSRSERLWRQLIGEDVWNMLEKDKRIVHRKHFEDKNKVQRTIRTQGFGRNTFHGDGFDRIVNAFKQSL